MLSIVLVYEVVLFYFQKQNQELSLETLYLVYRMGEPTSVLERMLLDVDLQ